MKYWPETPEQERTMVSPLTERGHLEARMKTLKAKNDWYKGLLNDLQSQTHDEKVLINLVYYDKNERVVRIAMTKESLQQQVDYTDLLLESVLKD